MPIIQKNVLTNEDEDDNLSKYFSTKTRVYSDSFRILQVNDFKRLVFILKKVSHSVWFGYSLFHNNTVESLWRQIKTYSDNFTGMSIKNLSKEFNNDENQIQEYLDGWITYGLLLRKFKRRRLS